LKSLVILGFKGVGKTTFGKKLATHFNYDFLDLDHLLEKKFNQTAKELYQHLGEKKFRYEEKKILEGIDFSKKQVVSLGGGSLLSDFHFPKKIHFIYLKQDKESLKKRLETLDCSFLEEHNFDASFEKMYREREPLFSLHAISTLDATKNHDDLIVEFNTIWQKD